MLNTIITEILIHPGPVVTAILFGVFVVTSNRKMRKHKRMERKRLKARCGLESALIECEKMRGQV